MELFDIYSRSRCHYISDLCILSVSCSTSGLIVVHFCSSFFLWIGFLFESIDKRLFFVDWTHHTLWRRTTEKTEWSSPSSKWRPRTRSSPITGRHSTTSRWTANLWSTCWRCWPKRTNSLPLNSSKWSKNAFLRFFFFYLPTRTHNGVFIRRHRRRCFRPMTLSQKPLLWSARIICI